MRGALILAGLLAALAGCAEQPQTPGTRKVDSKPWQGAENGYVATGWKAGDEASWDLQMRNRSQAQNEYARVPAQR